MNRLAICAAAVLAIVPAMAQSSQTIYKFVDESGRVTYANSPIKGGNKVALEPLTVIPSSPGATAAAVVAPPPLTPARAIPVAKVTSVPSSAYSIGAAPVAPIVFAAAPASISAPAPAAISAPAPASFSASAPAIVSTPAAPPPPITLAALDTADKVQERAQQRRADVRQRILQSEIQAEEKSLGEARAALVEEQRKSADMRAMRASFSTTAPVATLQKPLISPEVRAEIERHFERVRNLQDQVAMHEGNIAALREEMPARK